MGLSIEDYIDELEKERRKIEVFRRELPLCLELVEQVIEKYRREMGAPMETNRRNEADIGTPLLEEFIPLRPLNHVDHPKEVELEDNSDDHHDGRRDDGDRSEKKSDWLKTAQLWNENPEDVCEKVDEQKQRKTRRCWSPELHRRFVNALEQLGGCHATPKQIREIMKVEDLTNDEVKSHLQKYRLQTKRRNPGAKSNSSGELTQSPQVVFSIWMQPTGHPNLQPNPTAKSASLCKSNLLLQFDHHKQLKQKKSNRSPRGPLRSADQAENCDSCGTLGSF